MKMHGLANTKLKKMKLVISLTVRLSSLIRCYLILKWKL